MDIASDVDDTTSYFTGVNLNSTVKLLEKIADLLFTWFNCNQMKGKEDKYHAILSSQDNVHVNIGTAQIENSICQKLLGIFFFFFYLGFLSRTFTIHGTAGEGGGYLFNSSLPLPPASQTLRH